MLERYFKFDSNKICTVEAMHVTGDFKRNSDFMSSWRLGFSGLLDETLNGGSSPI